jgi:hypothetical protein
MLSFLYKVFCGNTETRDRINDLKGNLNGENNLIVKKYLTTVDYRYNLLKFKKKIFKGLRFLQFLGGFGITTMTTYNNPYFKENTEKISIMVWYVSISNNIINLLIEKLNAYDLTTEKMKINLLIREGELLLDNKQDYNYYAIDDNNKYYYFKKCYTSIEKNDPINYLTNGVIHESDEINGSRKRRFAKVWALPVPTPPKLNGTDENA